MSQKSSTNKDAQIRRGGWRRLLLRVTVILFLSYSGIVAYFSYFENDLVYPGQGIEAGDWDPPFAFEDVVFQSADGTKLHGWFIPLEQAQRNIVVFHGNAENVATTSSNYAKELGESLNANVFVFDYRGFGKSVGQPFERVVVEDGVAAVQWLSNRLNIKPGEMIFYGSSLGGGVAVSVASQTGCKMLLLDRTFGDICDPARSSYPWLPIQAIMRNKFDSISKIKDMTCPIFVSHFDADNLIPYSSAERLYNAIEHDKKSFLKIEGDDHWARLPNSYWPKLVQFVDMYDPVEVDVKETDAPKN
ncbi:MAG: alpha/beta hydrolase [Pirellulaceae bacterium]